jgi:hypothetical protein
VTRSHLLTLSFAFATSCGGTPEPATPPPRPKPPAEKARSSPPKSPTQAESKAPAPAPREPKDDNDNDRLTVTFNADPLGEPAAQFEAVIGDWYIGEHQGARGLWVDGTLWRQGTPSASLADQAKRLYGEHYAEFLDNVKAFAFYPVAVWKGDVPPGDLSISLRFYPESGRIDQAAGIVWGLTQDGRYWGVRANPLEDNILYFDVKRGKRKLHATIRGVPTPTHQWHTLQVKLKDGMCTVVLDGEERMSKKLHGPVTGRLGLWSKADSKVLFDDFVVKAI